MKTDQVSHCLGHSIEPTMQIIIRLQGFVFSATSAHSSLGHPFLSFSGKVPKVHLHVQHCVRSCLQFLCAKTMLSAFICFLEPRSKDSPNDGKKSQDTR